MPLSVNALLRAKVGEIPEELCAVQNERVSPSGQDARLAFKDKEPASRA